MIYDLLIRVSIAGLHPPIPSKLAQAHTSGGPLRHICRCTVPFWVEAFCSGVFMHLTSLLCTKRGISVPRLLLSLCEAQTRSPMNQSCTRMNGNRERIRELSHPVSSFDWIVSRRFWTRWEFGRSASTDRAVRSRPNSHASFAQRWFLYIYILTLGSLGHVLPYFPALAFSILTRAVTLATGLNVKWPEAVEE